MRIREKRRRANNLTLFILLALAVGAIGLVGVAGAARFGQVNATLGAAGEISPFTRLALIAYFIARAETLTASAGSDDSPQAFTVASGETASAIAERLLEHRLLAEAQALTFYLRYKGFDQGIEAGDFVLRQTMTIPEIAAALTDASAREIAVRIPEGWRREQMALALAANPQLSVSADEFLALTAPGAPPPGAYSFLGDLPPGASLEGYVFPDTYLLRPGATARDVLTKSLANFDAHLPANYRSALAAHKLGLHQAVIIASLIEREAVVDDERPIIASVILNRLAIGQPLEIDATVQYVVANAENWWPPVAGLDFRAIENPYNTYQVTGLPAGPIANPRLSSLLAVASPAQTNYYYYRALCDGSGRHAFAQTYDEHVQNACQ
jgi:UPF0755 protein